MGIKQWSVKGEQDKKQETVRRTKAELRKIKAAYPAARCPLPLGQTPLAPVEFPFACQQSLAEQTLSPLQCQTLVKILMVGNQNIFDVVRMI